jgi:tripartite-type tricarboxylate transporter receptor subunit TctC
MAHGQILIGAMLAFFLAGAATKAPAQDHASGPITLILPFPPGGLADLVARRLSQSVSEGLKQQIIVDYRAGGGGTIGAAFVKASPPDGRTLLVANNSIMAIHPSLMAKVSYAPEKDFAPVTMLVSTSHVLLVPAASPIRSFGDLVARARSKSGALTFASAGIGGGGHLLGEMLKRDIGGEFVHVPYKGAAPAMQDLLGNRIDFYFESVALAAPHVASGGARALAVTAQKRLANFPDIPTMSELGHPGVNADAWFGLFAPAGTAPAIVDRLNAEFVKALRDPSVTRPLTDQGLEVLPGTSAALADTLRTDLARYETLIRAIGAKVD